MNKNYVDNGDCYYSVKDSVHHRRNMTIEELNKELEAFTNLKNAHEKHVGHKEHENHIKNLEARIDEINDLIRAKSDI